VGGLFGTLDVATRGLLVTQSGIRVTSHNTANVETPGYTRQRQVLQAGQPISHPAGAIGTGVEQRAIERVDDALLFRQLYDADARNAALGVEANALSRIEELLNEQQEEGLGARLSRLYDSFEDLASASTPGAPVERESLRGAAQALADAFHGLDEDLRRLMSDSDRSAVGMLAEINGIAREIADLNDAIMRAEVTAPANDLRDRRDALVRQLAEQVEVSTFEQSNGGLVVMVADGLALVDGATARQLVAEPDPANPIDPRFSRISFDLGASRVDVTAQIGGGALGGHLEVRDAIAPAALREIDVLAYNLAVQTNAVHGAGVGLDGSSGDFFQSLGAVEDAARLFALDPAVAASTDAIAAGLGSDPGDNRNALALAALRETPTAFFRPGDPPGPPTGVLRTVLDAHAVMVGEFGESARNAKSAADGQQLMLDALQTRRDAISGVSLDEEMIRLIRLESAYQANARVISTIQTMLDTLVGLVA
jgi:flagellar hook-associated protein 1 FlgK